jgi:DNA-binding transcriptional MerR regulator
VRLSELAEQSGTSVPTIKFYIREGLLPPGVTKTGRQADYSHAHLERLRLVRALVDIGGLSLAGVRDVLAALSRPGGIDEAISVAHGALGPRATAAAPYSRAEAVMDKAGWMFERDSAPMAQLDSALAALEAVGMPVDDERVLTYAHAAMAVAEREVAGTRQDLATDPDPESAVRDVVLGTVLYEPLLLSLRRLAQRDAYLRLR